MKRTAVLVLFFLCLPLMARAVNAAAVWEESPSLNLTMLNQSVNVNDSLWFAIGINNPNDHEAYGNITVKIGRLKEGGGFEYPSEWVLMDNGLVSVGQASSLVMNFTWLANATEGIYKAYVRFDYNGSFTYRSSEFNVTSAPASGGDGTWHRIVLEAEFGGIIKSVYRDFLLSCPSVALVETGKTENLSTKAFDVVDYPEKLFLGKSFEVHVRLYNEQAYARNFTLYAYLYKDSKLVSSGFDGTSWKGGWTANKKEIMLGANESMFVTLYGRPESTGEMLLKVRVKDVDDFIVPVTVAEGKELPLIESSCSGGGIAAAVTIGNLDREKINLTVRHYGAGLVEKILVLKKGANQTVRFKSSTEQHYFLILSNNSILSECSVLFEQPEENATGKTQTGMGAAKKRSYKPWLLLLMVIIVVVALLVKKRGGKKKKEAPAEEEDLDGLVKRLDV